MSKITEKVIDKLKDTVVGSQDDKFTKCMLLMLVLAITTFVFLNGVELNPITPNTAYAKNRTSSQSLSNTISPSVRITSPIRGQDVQVGKNLIVSGISASRSSDCVVSVIVNGIKPYQNATATGSNGQNDYSRWTFLLIPKYTTIKEGMNKIASKISCGSNPSLVSHYTLNVTGLVGTGGSFSGSSNSPLVTTNKTPPQIAIPLP